MSDPIKVIWRYKNNNKRIQYHQYVFVGNVSKNIMKILEDIQEMSLYETLTKMSRQDYYTLESFYGSYWYTKFFNNYHISNTFITIKDNKTQTKSIKDKYGEKWFNEHIVPGGGFVEKQILYSYEAIVKFDITRKMSKKSKQRAMAIQDDDDNFDYRTQTKKNIETALKDSTAALRFKENQNIRENYDNKKLRNTSSISSTSSVSSISSTSEIEDLVDFTESVDSDETEESELPSLSDTTSDENKEREKEKEEKKDNKEDYTTTKSTKKNIIKSPAQIIKESDSSTTKLENYGDNVDYRPEEKKSIYDILKDKPSTIRFKEREQEGGAAMEDVEGGEDGLDDPGEEGEYEEDIETQSVVEEILEEEDIEDIYKEVDVKPDENINKTSELIKKAFDDERIFQKTDRKTIDFDTSKDLVMYDENLKDVYSKKYVTGNYIYKDDTIRDMKNKICCSIKNHEKYEKNAVVTPSRQYLWCEYIYDNKLEKVMVGQKWIRKNELLAVDVEPNVNLRIYEELRGNLRLLRDNIKRAGAKIRREDDETNIVYDYESFFTNNEFYMIDVYNELGKNFDPDHDNQRNLQDVYLRLYFPRIKPDDLKYLLDYLKGDTKIESTRNQNTFNTINNDLIMENEISKIVDDVRYGNPRFKKIFTNNYVTQSLINVNLRLKSHSLSNLEPKIDLFRIFNEFKPDDKYPFVQYQTNDGQIVFKYKEDDIYEYLRENKENQDIIMKWFENAPIGISFKVKINENGINKFMAIGLNEQARIEYKTQWKEEDMAKIEDIKSTYIYVRELVEKLNKDNNRFEAEIPIDEEFRYAFINSIQKFELPDNYTVNHNDLSDFSRFFFPYVAVVIEPRKRQSKLSKSEEKSKYGTYLRYKRVSKYENSAKMEQRIIYFIKNYEFTEEQLITEISKQFNITEERSQEEIERVRSKYPTLKKARKNLKKLENIPKYPTPGIGIDIQGKQRENYKIRISGARNKYQLDRILEFMNILIFLYAETYLLKRPERQELKDRLKKLTNIAKRRSRVDDYVKYSTEINAVKQMISADKQRLGFKPDKDQNQYTRCCQNSGTDKRRRPLQFSSTNLEELIKKGYRLNKKTNEYEKKVLVKQGSKKKEVTLHTIKVPEFDQDGNQTGQDIHYACSPEENGEHMYVGFLTRCVNPNGWCMPCCFKKDPHDTKNKSKREFFMKCLGQGKTGLAEDTQKVEHTYSGDKLYVLQDTNKIQDGRIGFLPKYLDFYFNLMLERDKSIKNHYLSLSKKGYFFKYGSKQEILPFMTAVSNVFDTTIDFLRERMIEALEKDKDERIFISLNNGDIKTQFVTKEAYIDHIKNNDIDFNTTQALLSTPGVLTPNGLNIVLFNKSVTVIKKDLEKEKIKEDFFITPQNNEDQYSIEEKGRKTIFILKENDNFYPIIMVQKLDEDTKDFTMTKLFDYDESDNDNIVNHVKEYYQKSCYESFIEDVINKNSIYTARRVLHEIEKQNLKEYYPRYQVIDIRNKCRYFVTSNSLLIPVRPSGCIYNIQIIKNIERDRYIKNLEDTYDYIKEMSTKLKIKGLEPVGVYYDIQNNTEFVSGLVTRSGDVVPIEKESIKPEKIKKMGLKYENKPSYDNIDKEINKGKTNIIVDERIKRVNFEKYFNESYQLFRLELSEYLDTNNDKKDRVKEIISNQKLSKQDKIIKIRLLIYKMIDYDLFRIYNDMVTKKLEKSENLENLENIERGDEIIYPDSDTETETDTKQTAGGSKMNIHIINNIPDLTHYQQTNERTRCIVHRSKEECKNSLHCQYSHSKRRTDTGDGEEVEYGQCGLGLTKNMIINFVNRVSEELVQNDLKAYEILKIGNYFVSDIADYQTFKEFTGQKIIKSSSTNIKKVLKDLFGKDKIPKIGRRKGYISEYDYNELNQHHPVLELDTMYLQNIIENNMTIFRAYANGFYWLKNKYDDNESRNLGYYNPIQTDYANYFKSIIIDWLQDTNNHNDVRDNLYEYMEVKKKNQDKSEKSVKNTVNDYIVKFGNDINIMTNCIIELYILSRAQDIPILVFDDDNQIHYVFNNGIMYNRHKSKHTHTPEYVNKFVEKHKNDAISFRFTFITGHNIPDSIQTIYYK